MNEIVRKDSIEELIGHRVRALQLYAQAAECLSQAREAHSRACIGGGYITEIDHQCLRFHISEPQKFSDSMTTTLDRDMWRAFIVNTPLGSLMDTQERKKFEEAIKGEPPEVTVDNVYATLSRLAGEAPMIFRRGLVNAFQNLSRDYKSHDGFKIGDRIILSGIVTYDAKFGGWLRTNHYREDVIKDVDRVMHVLDGKEAPEYQQGLLAAFRTAVTNWKTHGLECETEYWRLRFFKNGNGHLYPKRADLVQKANKLIAEHYGEVVGAAPDVATKRYEAPHTPENATEDFFATPDAVVSEIINLADIGDDHRVLEPSAGEGAIAKVLQAEMGITPDCVEMNPERAQKLRADIAGASVRQMDFLEMAAEPVYDRVLLNPPFSRNQATLHVEHALGFLRPGGRLVAVMPAGVRFHQEARTTALRARLTALGAQIRDLPEGAFKVSGTMVNAVLVVVDVPAEQARKAA